MEGRLEGRGADRAGELHVLKSCSRDGLTGERGRENTRGDDNKEGSTGALFERGKRRSEGAGTEETWGQERKPR